jgi:LPS export ABC transporter protein LptC
MRDFAITRFAPDGRATVRIEGAWLRHFPDTDRIEIEDARVRARTPDGRVTQAQAARALGNGDASEWQLSGGAKVVAQMRAGPPLEIDGDFLHVFVRTERVRSHLPVRLRQGDDEIHAGGIEVDNLAQRVQLSPPVRGNFSPRVASRFAACAAGPMNGTTAPLVFITGASSGIGQALAARFHAQGWRLALVARREAEVRAWARSQAIDAAALQVYAADVRDIAAITATGRACIEQQGLPQVVIANAGISAGIDSALIQDLEVMRATLDTNNLGLAATFQPFIEPMRQRRAGTLVGIASVAGIRGLPGHAAYCASKAAVIAYCESLRGECRPFGMRVVTIVPGYIDTPLTRGNPYPMPFLMAPERFAATAMAAIVAGHSYRVIPWQMGVVAKLLRLLPNVVFDRLLAGRPRKPRRPAA